MIKSPSLVLRRNITGKLDHQKPISKQTMLSYLNKGKSSGYHEFASFGHIQTQMKGKSFVVFYLVTIFLFSFPVMVLVFMIFEPRVFGESSMVTQCGDSAESARTLGCFFDIMSFSWIPPECFDEALTREFDRMQAWEWFEDVAGRKPVTKTEVLQGTASQLYVSFDYHRAHCTFMWKKFHRAIGEGNLVDSYIGSYNHTLHCERMLLIRDEDLDSLNTRIVAKFPLCDSRTVSL
jgi:hypothetical protein